MNVKKILYPLSLVCICTSTYSGTYSVTSPADDGSDNTLRWAIGESNSDPFSDIVIVNNQPFNIELTSSLPDIVETVTISSFNDKKSLISYSGSDYVFVVNDNSECTLSNIFINAENGIDVQNDSNLIISGIPSSLNSNIKIEDSKLILEQDLGKRSKGSFNFYGSSIFLPNPLNTISQIIHVPIFGYDDLIIRNSNTTSPILFAAPLTFNQSIVTWDGPFKLIKGSQINVSEDNTFIVNNDFLITNLFSTGSGNNLTFQGAGKPIINGDVSFDGTITIGDGISSSELMIASSSNSTTFQNIDFNIENASTLKFSNRLAETITVDTNLTGSGSLRKLGQGNLIFNLQTDTNFNGDIYVDSGALTIEAVNNLNPSNINILEDSFLILDVTNINPYENSSNINAVGKLQKKGEGALTFTNAFNIQGNLEILEGKLILDGSDASNINVLIDGFTELDATSLSSIKSVTGFGNLTFDELEINTPFQDKFFGDLDGNSITMNGSGTFSLEGDLNFDKTIEFYIDNGTLKINGDYSYSSAVVYEQGTLGGIGKLFQVYNHGVVNPGNSVGTLYIENEYYQDASATLEIEVEGLGKVDQLIVSGEANLDGILNISKYQGSHIDGKQYLILEAKEGINGDWATTILPDKTSLFKEDNKIYLQIEGNQIFVDKNIVGTNPIIVSDYLEKNLHLASLGLLDYIAAMDYMPNDPLNTVLDKLHPGQFSAISVTQESINAQQSMLFTRHSNNCCNCTSDNKYPNIRNYLWIQPIGNTLSVTPGNQLQSFYNNSYGMALGIEHFFSNSFDIGASLGYISSSLHWGNNYAKASMNDLFAALYIDYVSNNWYINSSLKGGIDFIQTRRNLNFSATTLPVIDGKILDFKPVYVAALGHPKSYELATHIESGLDITLFKGCITPYISLDVLGVFNSGFEESEAGPLDLLVNHKNYWFLRSFIGVEFNHSFVFTKGSLCPNVSLGYTNIQTFASDYYTANFIGIQDTFTVIAKNNNWSLISPGLSLMYQHKNGYSIGGSYKSDIWKNYWSNYFDLTIAYKF